MNKNELLNLTCERLGADMEGVCRHQGMAVFVPGLLPGEQADVRIVKVEKRYAFGRIAGEIINPSADRKASDCAAYPRCGGCTCRHMTYAATLEAKRQQVLDCFERIGHMRVEVAPVIGMAQPVNYRNKTALPVGGTVDAPCVGFYAPRSHTIVAVSSCPNAMQPTDRVCEAFLNWMRDFHVSAYDEKTGKGFARHLVVRVSRLGGVMAVIVANGEKLPGERELCECLRAAGVTQAVLNIHCKPGNVILGDRYRTLYGEGLLEEELCGLRFSIAPAAFFQVNPSQTEKLYQTALQFAQLRPEDHVCDIYCGAGTITLMLAQHCAQATGIEVVPQAIENAKENARRNHIDQVRFLTGAAEKVLPELVRDGLRPDVMVVDPPRKGLDPAVIDAMVEAAPRRIVYVSCNVATQARDAALLAEKGYRVERVQPVDMFAWTSGVETVISMSQQRLNHYAHVGLDLDDMDVTPR